MTNKGKIRQLIEIVVEHEGETGHPDRFTRAERKFFKKHPDWVIKVFRGPKSHVRANEIVRKMRVFGFNVDDVEMVRRALINGPVISKTSAIFLKLKGLVGRE